MNNRVEGRDRQPRLSHMCTPWHVLIHTHAHQHTYTVKRREGERDGERKFFLKEAYSSSSVLPGGKTADRANQVRPQSHAMSFRIVFSLEHERGQATHLQTQEFDTRLQSQSLRVRLGLHCLQHSAWLLDYSSSNEIKMLHYSLGR